MKSNTQQVVSIFLAVCLLIGLLLGIITNGYSDFSMFEYKPQAVAEESNNVVANCSTDIMPADVQSAGELPITWENERVEYEFSLASGDIDSDAGFSISEDGGFIFSNEICFSGLFSEYDDIRLVLYQEDFDLLVCSFITINAPYDSQYSYFKETNVVRSICRFYGGLSIENYKLGFVAFNEAAGGGYFLISDVVYNVTISFLDRMSIPEFPSDPEVEEGYIFDGWSSSPDEYRLILPSDYKDKFIYSDKTFNFYPIIEPKVEVKLVYLSGKIETCYVCKGCTTSPSTNLRRCMSERTFYQKICWRGAIDGSGTYSWITADGQSLSIIDSDVMLFEHFELANHFVSFVVDGEIVDTISVKHGDIAKDNCLDLDKPGFDFDGWHFLDKNGCDIKYEDQSIESDLTLIAKFVLHSYTATLYRCSFFGDYIPEEVEFFYNDHSFDSNVFSKKYIHLGWAYESGELYDPNSFIYEDISLWEIVEVVQYQLTVFYGTLNEAFYHKTVKSFLFDYGTSIRLTSLAMDDRPGYSSAWGYIYADPTIWFSPYSDTYSVRMDKDWEQYFVYTPIIYTVNFHSDYEMSFDTVTFTCEDKFLLPELECREGYDFLGWYDKNGALYKEDSVILSNLDLYDKWQIQKKTVTLLSDGVVQWTFNVDYGTFLNDVLAQINYKNYNVVSFTAEPLNENNCFIDNVSFEVQKMDKQDSVINTVKNRWQIIVAIVAGVVLLSAVISLLSKSKKRYKR